MGTGGLTVDIVAVLCLRNDDEYLANNLRHLAENNISFAVIDNGIGEAGRAILARPALRRHLVALSSLRFDGQFDLRAQIAAKQAMFDRLPAEWLIHLDADEIMHSFRADETLHDAIVRIDAAGWTAINFDEFVFLPVAAEYQSDVPGWQALRHYYLFQPRKPRLMRASKRSAGISMIPDTPGSPGGNGHELFGPGLRLAPESFALRHYIFRDQAHALAKYPARRFSEIELRHRWHGNRVGFAPERFRFPPPSALQALPSPISRAFDVSRPHTLHYWQWPS